MRFIFGEVRRIYLTTDLFSVRDLSAGYVAANQAEDELVLHKMMNSRSHANAQTKCDTYIQLHAVQS